MNRRRFLMATAALGLSGAASSAARADLRGFLSKTEPAYRWEKRGEKAVAGGVIYDLWMVSQTWQGGDWGHRLQVFWPTNVERADFCALLNTGGGGSPAEEALGMGLATRMGSVFAILYHIPNQPLYGGLNEDALIAYTWQKFLETGDDSWPLHFPMAKAVVKAMDTVQAFGKSIGKPEINRFLITGASKRGWTTWLVGASNDPRVAAIAPMVIDTLNVSAQIPHQLEMFGGKPSEQVADYTKSGFDKILLTPKGKQLMALEDPYSYRDKLTLPKLLILGTNDRYWAQDALNLYWEDLKGPKWVLYTPNSGHGLEDKNRVLATMVAFARTIAAKSAWPKLSWEYRPITRGVQLTISSDTPMTSARLFSCTSESTDFRDSKWSSVEVTSTSRQAIARFAAPTNPAADARFAAIFGEATFANSDKNAFTLSTQIRIIRP